MIPETNGQSTIEPPAICVSARLRRSLAFVDKLRGGGVRTVAEAGAPDENGLFMPLTSKGERLPFLPSVAVTKEVRFLTEDIAPHLAQMAASGRVEQADGFRETVFDAELADGYTVLGQSLADIWRKLRGQAAPSKRQSEAYFRAAGRQGHDAGWKVRVAERFFTGENSFINALAQAGWTRRDQVGYVLRHEYAHAFMTYRNLHGEDCWALPKGCEDEATLLGGIFTRIIHGEAAAGSPTEFRKYLISVFAESYADCRGMLLMDTPDATKIRTLGTLRHFYAAAIRNSSHETWRSLDWLADRLVEPAATAKDDHRLASEAACVGTISFLFACMRHDETIREHVLAGIKDDPILHANLLRFHFGNKTRSERLATMLGVAAGEVPACDDETRLLGNLLMIATKVCPAGAVLGMTDLRPGRANKPVAKP